jgi:hypothetical protein
MQLPDLNRLFIDVGAQVFSLIAFLILLVTL